MFRLTLSLTLSLFVALGSSLSWAEDEAKISKVLFLPLDGESAGKYAPLVSGISNMLASQLSSRERIVAVDYNLKKQEIDKLIKSGAEINSKTLDLDYVIRGSVYGLEKGMSLQVKVLAMDSSVNRRNFSVKANGEEEVFAAVDTMAEKVAKDIFGYDSIATTDVGTTMGLAGFTTAHPEKEYKKGIIGSGGLFGANQLGNVANVKGVRKSPALPMDIVAMGTGDFDGNGKPEMVYASRTKLLFYNNNNGRFEELGEHTLPKKTKVNALYVADLNGDGRDEMFVSANFGGKARSYILSWDKANGVQEVLRLRDWFIQIVEKEGRVFLAGQRGIDDAARGYVLPGLYELDLDAKYTGFDRGEQLALPEGVGLLSFAYADLNGNGKDEIVAIDKRERLLVYGENNELLHVSVNNYGGSTNFFGVGLGKSDKAMKGQDEDLNKGGEDRNFIPTRLVIVDIDGDGNDEIVVGTNRRDELVTSARENEKKKKAKKDGKIDLFDGGIGNAFSNLFPNLRVYEGGVVSCLSYQEGALKQEWTTNKIAGFLPDYNYTTEIVVDGDGNQRQTVRLTIGQVPNRSFLDIFSGEESKVHLYEFSYKN